MWLAIVKLHFALHQCLSLKMLFFLRVTKLGDRHLISSLSQIIMVQMTTLEAGDVDVVIFCDKRLGKTIQS
jgi:hypothetical protein